jgi:hypothetical protein
MMQSECGVIWELWWRLAQICGIHGGLSVSIRRTGILIVPHVRHQLMHIVSHITSDKKALQLQGSSLLKVDWWRAPHGRTSDSLSSPINHAERI